MTPEQADELRRQSAGLRLKASTGTLAVAAARDVAAQLPTRCANEVSARIESGELAQLWEKAKAAAFDQLANLDNNGEVSPLEIEQHALVAMLAWYGKVAQRQALEVAAELERKRLELEGRAKGIEDTLATLLRQ